MISQHSYTNFTRCRNGCFVVIKLSALSCLWVCFYARSKNCEKRLLASLCSSVRPHGITRLPLIGLLWNVIFGIFRKPVRKVRVSLESDKNKGYFTWRTVYLFFIISRSVLLRVRNVSDKIVEKIKRRTLCFFFKSCRLWDNVEKYCRAWKATDDNMEHKHCMLDN